MNKTLESALSYVSRGWKVFPVVGNKKVPATPNGFKDATGEVGNLIEFFGWDNPPNLGIATGRLTNLIVLDFDKKNGGLETLERLKKEHPGTFTTLTVRTPGGGFHYYFTYPADFTGSIRSSQGVFAGTDVRAELGYVVGPPSTIDGIGYEWVESQVSPLELPEWLVTELADYGNKINHSNNAINDIKIVSTDDSNRIKGALAKGTLAFIATGAPDGTWHQEFYKACMDLKQNQFSYGEAEDLLKKATGHLDDEHDYPTLLDVYENREPRHPPRLEQFVSVITTPGSELDHNESLVESAQFHIEGMFKSLTNPQRLKGVPTGIPGMDELLGGGKRMGELTVTMALAKSGKSSLYAYLIHSLLTRGIPVAYASREMRPDTEVLPNLLSIEFGESIVEKAMNGTITDADMAKYREVVRKWPLTFSKGYGKFHFEQFSAWVNESYANGVQFFFVDHLHQCLSNAEDWQEGVEFALSVKKLTNTMDIHVDLIVQPTKIGMGMELSMNTMRGGAGLNQALDNLFIMEPYNGVKDARTLKLDICRFPLASKGRIILGYDKMSRTFTEMKEQPTDNVVTDGPWNNYTVR